MSAGFSKLLPSKEASSELQLKSSEKSIFKPIFSYSSFVIDDEMNEMLSVENVNLVHAQILRRFNIN
jgi:hypothetical protein